MDFRALALSLPETTEKDAWGHVTFRVRDKMFAIMGMAGEDNVRVKSTLDEQTALTQMDPETFSVPGYVGKYGWIRIELERVDPEELAELVTEAWRLTAPKRL
ncbi:MAG: hypothetical protein QOJ12_2016, partial [Thermoleophilales bacterium]|nr:hypothetical protein [Thermoleophilales bacterium]